jgi:hypothetical protein
MRSFYWSLVVLGLATILPSFSHAGEEPLRAAFESELMGDDAARQRQLEEVKPGEPGYEEAQWQLGRIRTADGWEDAAKPGNEPSANELEYRALRDKLGNDIEANRQLAKFCRKHKLHDNERGHWRRVIDLSRNDIEARKALGHVPFMGGWSTKAEIDRLSKATGTYTKAMGDWAKKLQPTIADLYGKNAEKKEKARAQLLAIRDAAAIPVLVNALAYQSDESTSLLVEILSEIRDFDSTRVLAEIGVMTHSPAILDNVAHALKDRDDTTWVPQVLVGLSSPVTSQMQLDYMPELGMIMYRHVFVRETQFDHQLMAWGYDSEVTAMNYTAFDLPQFSGANTINPSLPLEKSRRNQAHAAAMEEQKRLEQQMGFKNTPEDMAARYNSVFYGELMGRTYIAMKREQQKKLQNLTIEDTNTRIGLLLSRVFDDNNGTPEQWWSWWNQRHETHQTAPKPLRTQMQYFTVQQPVAVSSIVPPPQIVMMSCFAAGTKVATKQGLRPIESLKTGDLVLSQSVETGELAWKAVVEPTIRPKTQVQRMTVGSDTFVCTLKHPFWKTGKGWTWAKDLKDGDLIRTANGSLPVSSIERAPDIQVHNLIIADFSTYFVGESRLLTHGTTVRAPTLAIAPGVFPPAEE